MPDPADHLAPEARARLRAYYVAKIDETRASLAKREAAQPANRGSIGGLQTKIADLEAKLAALGPDEGGSTGTVHLDERKR